MGEPHDLHGSHMLTHTVYSDIVEIDAPKAWVWNILEDIKAYPTWNPFTYQVDGALILHHPLDLHVRMPLRGDRMQTEIVERIDKPDLLAWGMTLGAPFILNALRKQELHTIHATRCTYSTSDRFSGLLAPLVYRLFHKDVRQGFNDVAYALKRRAEFLWQQHNIHQGTPIPIKSTSPAASTDSYP